MHQWIYFGGLTLLAIGLPSSVFLMSVSQIILFLNWLIEGRFGEKFRRFFDNKAAMVFASIYLVHIVALFYSSNWDYGVSTLRTRLPIFLLTLVVVSSGSLPKGFKRWILLAFSGSITVVSFFSLYVYFAGNFMDYRELSPFVSHIRLSLMVALSVFSLLYLAGRGFRGHRFWQVFSYGLAGYHVFYLVLLHSLSGVAVLLAVIMVLAVRQVLTMPYPWRTALIAAGSLFVIAAGLLLALLWSNVTKKEAISPGALEEFSSLDTPYTHNVDNPLRENGYQVYIYLAEEELREAWNRYSELDYDGYNHRGEPVRHVLLRYMSSLGLRKDANDFKELSDRDLQAIEKGIANVRYTTWPWIITRLHQSMWEIQQYRLTGDPAGHSLAQRLEFWKAAWEAIKKKPLLGWGTGDIREASQYGLEQINTSLQFERWMKPHNQYLSFTVLFGIPGALWILFAMVYPARKLNRFSHLPFLAFFVILWISMLNEDTIDTQAGLSFFVFFHNYFLFLKDHEE